MKIVFLLYHPSVFTNWVNKLSPFLKDADFYVLHISKLHGVQPEIKNDYKSIDISYYSYGKLERLLHDINPGLFVFLSFRSLLEYTINRLCVNLNIRKIYLEHGFFSTDTLKFRKNKLKKEIIKTMKRQFAFWYLQMGLIVRNKHLLSEIKSVYDVYWKGNFKTVPYDHYYVFSERSFDCYKAVFDLNENNTTYIGYPIFNCETDKLHVNILTNTNGVLYVHQPLISDGIAQISYDEEKSYLKTLAQKVKDRYGNLIILLHPRANFHEYKKRYHNTDIEIVQSPNNYRCFTDKSLIIGHYSTALMYGLYFNKPTIVIDYPTVEIADIFKKIFIYCNDITDLSKMIVSTDMKQKEYIVGKHNTFEYIAKTLLNDKNNTVFETSTRYLV